MVCFLGLIRDFAQFIAAIDASISTDGGAVHLLIFSGRIFR